MRGFVGIGSGTDRYESSKDRSNNSVMGLGDMESSSEELNLHTGKGIQKTTEVVVERESMGEDEISGNRSKHAYAH